MHRYEFSEEDAKEIVSYARDALEVYLKEGQKMDVGSVSDLLNMRSGIFLQITSDDNYARVRGVGSAYDRRRMANSIIDSTVYAASKRSIGSEISRSEISDVSFKISPIEMVYITDDPIDEIKIGYDVPIIVSESNYGWMYPTSAYKYDWSPEDYLTRCCEKINCNPDYWRDRNVVIARTRPIKEQNNEYIVDIE